ncbi:MAG: heavy metal-responsive transcriptional regulator [Acidimicrobiales bacterium]
MRIGEAADAVGVNPKTIRYYEDIGLLPEPERTASGYRDYTSVEVERLVFVKTAQRLGFTLAEVGEILAFREQGQRPCTYVLGVLERQVGDLDRRISELQHLRAELVDLKAQADRLPTWEASFCGLIEHTTAKSAAAKES